jgi:sarcosine oxidase subunit delta
MLLIPCPHCGPRPEIEFHYAGAAQIVRPANPTTADDREWCAFLYERPNPWGPHKERWYHLHGCGRYSSVVRDTTTDRFVATGLAPEGKP